MRAGRGACLGEHEVHLWRFATCREGGLAWEDLSEEERQRARQLRSPELVRRFVAAHAGTRRILSRYVGLPPAAIPLTRATLGKPALDLALGSCVQFNLSHSGDLALLAVGRDVALGVDVEAVRPAFPFLEVARTVFSHAEQAELSALSPGEQQAAFFRGWTRKEAFAKAIGAGLLVPLDAFDVALVPDAPQLLLGCRLPGEPVEKWRILNVEAGSGYAAAVAVADAVARLVYRS